MNIMLYTGDGPNLLNGEKRFLVVDGIKYMNIVIIHISIIMIVVNGKIRYLG